MRVLVTGASGFIGKRVVERLRGEQTVRRACRSRLEPVAGVEDVRVDHVDAETDWNAALDGVGTVVHLAALAHRTGAGVQPTLAEYRAINTAGTANLARQSAAAGVRRLVFLSSIGVNGQVTATPFSETSPCRPHSDYARSKHEAEMALADLAAQTGLETVVLRPPLVYGSHAPANFRQLVRLVSRMPLLPFGRVRNARSLVHVDNLADVIELCCRNESAVGKLFLVSDDTPVSTRELTDLIAAALGKHRPQLPIPVSLMRAAARLLGKAQLATQLFGDLEVDNSYVRETLRWAPRYDTRDGIAGCDFTPMFEP